jgi:hypothetical protein
MELPSPISPAVKQSDSPLYLLAVLVAARKSGDRILARVTHRRLTALGVDVRFADELTPQKGAKLNGGCHAG